MKYDLSIIMKRAWKYKKRNNKSMSYNLKKSWKVEKNSSIKDLYFEKYHNMIKKIAGKVSRRFNVEYDETKSQAYLIFCEAIEKYDKDKSSFSTYLYQRLWGYLSAYYKKNNLNSIEFCGSEDILFKKFCKVITFYDEINSKELTEDAKKIIDFLINNTIKKISIYNTAQYFNLFYNWTYQRCITAWKEIKIWWNRNRYYYAI